MGAINALMKRARLIPPDHAGWSRLTLPRHAFLAGSPALACGALLLNIPEVGRIVSVAVDPSQRRQGMGSRMVQHLCAVAADQGVAELWLDTLFWNIRFYAANGFEHVPVRQVPAEIIPTRINPHCCFMRRRIAPQAG